MWFPNTKANNENILCKHRCIILFAINPIRGYVDFNIIAKDYLHYSNVAKYVRNSYKVHCTSLPWVMSLGSWQGRGERACRVMTLDSVMHGHTMWQSLWLGTGGSSASRDIISLFNLPRKTRFLRKAGLESTREEGWTWIKLAGWQRPGEFGKLAQLLGFGNRGEGRAAAT